jgi:predicted nicotinamide N-methyase
MMAKALHLLLPALTLAAPAWGAGPTLSRLVLYQPDSVLQARVEDIAALAASRATSTRGASSCKAVELMGVSGCAFINPL